jgi:hypothetical protein
LVRTLHSSDGKVISQVYFLFNSGAALGGHVYIDNVAGKYQNDQ